MFHGLLHVELYVSRVEGTKYLFKFVRKGNDCVTVQLKDGQQQYDDIFQCLDA